MNNGSDEQGLSISTWEQTRALRAGITSGATFGAVVGGVGGRIAMRLTFLLDQSTDHAKTGFGGTVGEITVGGTLGLMTFTTIAGVIGGSIYIAVRRWLPWSGLPRGVFFGLLMMFGPGVVALGDVDLEIFEPALPIFAMFVVLIVLYGVGVALVTDRLHAPPAVLPDLRMEFAARMVQCLLAVGLCVMAGFATYHVHDKAGSCLSADPNTGGCAARPTD